MSNVQLAVDLAALFGRWDAEPHAAKHARARRDPARRAELMDALTNGVPDDVVAQVVATRGGDRGHVAQELARQAGPFREALKRVAIATKLGRKIDKDRDAEAGGDDLTDEDIVQRLREMGPCPMGFAWHREGSGWRCGGGSHFVHDDDPMLQA